MAGLHYESEAASLVRRERLCAAMVPLRASPRFQRAVEGLQELSIYRGFARPSAKPVPWHRQCKASAPGDPLGSPAALAQTVQAQIEQARAMEHPLRSHALALPPDTLAAVD